MEHRKIFSRLCFGTFLTSPAWKFQVCSAQSLYGLIPKNVAIQKQLSWYFKSFVTIIHSHKTIAINYHETIMIAYYSRATYLSKFPLFLEVLHEHYAGNTRQTWKLALTEWNHSPSSSWQRSFYNSSKNTLRCSLAYATPNVVGEFTMTTNTVDTTI